MLFSGGLGSHEGHPIKLRPTPPVLHSDGNHRDTGRPGDVPHHQRYRQEKSGWVPKVAKAASGSDSDSPMGKKQKRITERRKPRLQLSQRVRGSGQQVGGGSQTISPESLVFEMRSPDRNEASPCEECLTQAIPLRQSGCIPVSSY